MNPRLTSGLVLLVGVVALDLWVYQDARARQRAGRDVTVTIGSVEIDRPETWAALCLVVFVVSFPLYLVARRASE